MGVGTGTDTGVSFGDLLRRHRLAVGLTQEALAERAGVSARNIQALEGSQNRPLRDTARRLAGALALSERERALFLGAVTPIPRRRTPAASPEGIAVPHVAALPQHNLPSPLSSFIGREQARTRVRDLLAAHRLVTLVGSGGVGKTRLALAVAEELLPAYADGAWLVELASVNDPALLPGVVAQALGLREEPDRPFPRALADYLKERQLLLVLDNCEHLIHACADLAPWVLRAGPAVRLLATSREGLGVAGERRYRVPPLSLPMSLPNRRHPPTLDVIARSEAVRLFVERAQEQRDDFTIDQRNGSVVAEICARLDGVPLAIELAAARAGSMRAEDIAARLHDRFRLLSGSARNLPPRQRTLRAALDWSWDLLEESERALLRRLAVFAGGWTLDAAEAVLGEGAGSAPWAVLDGLDALVGKSLVQVDEAGEETARYRLLETVQEYAGERLASDEDAAPVHDRHLAWCVTLAQEAAPRLTGPDQAAWLARLEAEHENLRAALGWARQQGETVPLLRLAAALWRFWYLRGYLSEGRTWLAAALSLTTEAPSAGAPRAWATALHGAGVLAWTQGEHAQAVTLAEQALAHWRALGEQGGMAPTLNLLGLVAIDQGDWARARTALEESLTLYRIRQDRWGIATELHNLGTVARRQGDPERAAALYEESLALRRTLGDAAGMAISYLDQGLLAAEQGEHEQAVTRFRAGLTQATALGDAVRLAQCLEGLALVATRQDRAEAATQLLGAAAALRERIQAPIAPAERTEQERLVSLLRLAMGPAFQAALATGRAMPWEQLVASAFATDDLPAPPSQVG